MYKPWLLTESAPLTLFSRYHSLLGIPTWGPSALVRYRFNKHLTSVRADDALLIKEDMGASLTRSELREALEERGLYVSLSHVLSNFAF